MGRHLVDLSQDSDIKSLKSGVWKFILHVLDIHPKNHDVKKMIHHNKHGGGRVISCCANPKTDSMERICSESKEIFLDDESSSVETVTRTSSEASRKHKGKRKLRKCKDRSKLRRTDSIHHLETSSYGLSWMNPVILIQKKADPSSIVCENPEEKSVLDIKETDDSSRKFCRPSAAHLVKGHEEVLEIFQVNKELFFDIMQHHKVGKHSFSGKRLVKSGSFPAADSPRSVYSRLTNLEHKRNEVWFISKREKAWNQFKDIKQRIKLAIKEKRRRMTSDSDYGLHNVSSLNESSHRYSHLFEQSFSKDVKLHQSKSLKLTNKDKQTPKFFRRISSLSELESFISILNEVTRDEGEEKVSQKAPMPISFPVGDCEKKPEEAVSRTEAEERSKEEEDCNSTDLSADSSDKVLQPDIVFPDKCPVDEIIELDDQHPLAEGPEMNTSNTDNKADACSCYVSLLLHISGFTENESFFTWHSPDQPLSPSLFQDMETSYNAEQFPRNCSHRLLFDLVNESLVKIYDQEPVYFPKGFSVCPKIRSKPEGRLLADEVSGNLRCKLRSSPVQDQSLDDIVGRDFGKDNWMNLQMETECLALDLEEVIFDELLGEVISL